MALRVLSKEKVNLFYLIDFSGLLYFPPTHCTVFEKSDNKWVISLHNFSNVSYLNLPEMRYVQSQLNISFRNFFSREIDKVITDLENTFMKKINGGILFNLLDRMKTDPGSFKMVKTLLSFLRLSKFELHFGVAKQVFLTTLETLYTYHDNCDFVTSLLRMCYHLEDVQGAFRNWEMKVKHIKYIIEKCYEARFDVHKFMTCDKTKVIGTHGRPFCPVIDSLLEGKVSYLALFIEYGFQCKECNRLQYCKLKNLLEHINNIPIDVPLLASVRRQYHDHSENRQYLCLDLIIILYFFLSSPSKSRKSEWLQCGQLLFNSVPDPYVSWNELRTVLEERESQESRDLLSRMSSARKERFSEIIPEVYEPRKLTHLCRCVIRSALRDNFQLPKGLQKLKVPFKVYKYLQLIDAN